MITPRLDLAPISEEAIPSIIDLMEAQAARLHACDPHLPPVPPREEVEALVVRQCRSSHQPFLIIDAEGRACGYVYPALWELSEKSILHAFLTARNGIAQCLTLPDPAEEDARAIASTLLAALSDYWQREHTTGDLIRWPSCDPWLEAVLVEYGFQPDSVCALHPAGPSRFARRPYPSSLIIRHARPEDEDVLVALFEEELRLHQDCIPFARVSQEALQGFRQKLAHLWSGTPLEQGAPLILVAERDQRVVAMAENTLLDVSSQDEPRFTPTGRYGCIDNVCVHKAFRGQGIGHLLVQAVFDAFAPIRLEGYVLWYNPGNALAERFWPRLGFEPLWITYQRLHNMAGAVV